MTTQTPEIKEGYVNEYYHVRWVPYKKDGARQMRKKGRWQRSNGYGGYENCDTPARVYPGPIDYDSAAKLIAERNAALARVRGLEAALGACVAAHETGRFEPARAAYHNAIAALLPTKDNSNG